MPANGNDIMNKAMTLAADVECCLNVIRNTTLLGAIASFKCVCLNRPFKINIIMFRVFLFFFSFVLCILKMCSVPHSLEIRAFEALST